MSSNYILVLACIVSMHMCDVNIVTPIHKIFNVIKSHNSVWYMCLFSRELLYVYHGKFRLSCNIINFLVFIWIVLVCDILSEKLYIISHFKSISPVQSILFLMYSWLKLCIISAQRQTLMCDAQRWFQVLWFIDIASLTSNGYQWIICVIVFYELSQKIFHWKHMYVCKGIGLK